MSIRSFTRSLRYILVASALALSLLMISSRALATGQAAGNTYVVNSTADQPDIDPSNGICFSAPSGQCTLRAAIMEANFATDPNTITASSGIYQLTRSGHDDTALVGAALSVFTARATLRRYTRDQ